MLPGTPPKWANARRWQSQNVARSMLVVKQLNGSRECDNTMWNEYTVRDADVGQQVALIAPVDLGLRPGHDLEPAVQPAQRVVVRSRPARRRSAAGPRPGTS